MNIEEFEKQIDHLDQTEILTGAISSLNKLLVDKNLVQEEELQNYLLEWIREHKRKNGKAETK